MGRIVGIDLGTTNSLVAIMTPGGPAVIEGPDRSSMVPSIVHFAPDMAEVGKAARRYLTDDPGNTVYSVKRLMGKSFEDAQPEQSMLPYRMAGGNVVKIQAGGREWTPPEVSALILRELKQRAEAALKEEITQAVITVPAYFNDAQRQATKDAGRIAGLEVLRLVNEPTAASLAYGLDRHKEATIAVYDFGGGTFDISILHLSGGIFEVKATAGDTHLGGDDIDRLLADLLFREVEQQYGVRLQDAGEGMETVRLAAEEAKRALSQAEALSLEIPLGEEKSFKRRLTRTELEDLARPVVERTLEPCRRALADAGLDVFSVDEVVMVGGSTRMPLVRQMVADLFQRTPHTELNPDEVVAVGAAIQADILSGGSQDVLLLDVTPLSLGIETMGGAVEKIIFRNSTIPTSATQQFTTGVDNQTAVDLHVLQGERELAGDCRSLGRFQLRGIPPLPAGVPIVSVTFMLDANGILQVYAEEQRTGQKAGVVVHPSYGLTEDEVDRMVEESFEYAEEDIRARILVDTRVEAESTMHHTRKQLAQWGHLLSEDERAHIEKTLEALQNIIHRDDFSDIREKSEDLNEVTRPFAERILDATIHEALAGKTLEEAEQSPAADVKK